MFPRKDKVLTEPQVVSEMAAFTSNSIVELRVNNVYLETLKRDQKRIEDQARLASQLRQNREQIAELEAFLAFLRRLKKTIRVGSLTESAPPDGAKG